MKTTLTAFWRDQSGFLVSTELVIIATVLVLGLMVGLSAVQSAVVCELNDVARAVTSMNQTFFLPGFWGCRGVFTGGSGFVDNFLCAQCAGVGGFGNGGVGGFGGGMGGGMGGW